MTDTISACEGGGARLHGRGRHDLPHRGDRLRHERRRDLARHLLPQPPPNDDFANAEAIGLPDDVTGSIDNATLEAGEPDLSEEGLSVSVWYRYSAAASGPVKSTPAPARSSRKRASTRAPTSATSRRSPAAKATARAAA